MNELTINIANKTFSYSCNDFERYKEQAYFDFRDDKDVICLTIDSKYGTKISFMKSRLDIIKFIR